MIQSIQKYKGTFIISCLLILVAVMAAKEYFLTGTFIYKRWTSEGGLVISGWRAVGIISAELLAGLYGLISVLRRK